MAEFLFKHIFGGAILLALSVTAYFIYCGIGYIFLKLKNKRKINDADKIKEIPLIDIQTLIQARLRGIQQIKLDALKSFDFNTAYKMKGAEEVCNAILADLSEATKG